MVEGDAIAFARELARELGVRCHPHEKFQTAVVKGTRRATATSCGSTSRPRAPSSTARPGALPEVERSTLRHDLARRDFTINAMATSLQAEDLGATYDFFGGFRDLRRGTVRVLHNLSFVEDPTRLLRAIRYEARLGFRMDAHTLSLARGCIEMRLVGDLSSARLRDELLDMLAEPQRGARRSSAWPSWASTARCTRTSTPGREPVALVARAARLAAEPPFAERVRAPLVRLACLCRRMAADEIYEWLEQLKLRRRDQDVVAAAVTLAPAARRAPVGRRAAGAVGAARAARGPAARGAR